MAVGNYVQYVFAMTPGTLTLVGSMLVLLFQPSEVSFKNKGKNTNVCCSLLLGLKYHRLEEVHDTPISLRNRS